MELRYYMVRCGFKHDGLIIKQGELLVLTHVKECGRCYMSRATNWNEEIVVNDKVVFKNLVEMAIMP